MMDKDKQINLAWLPFGYSYSMPLSLGYVKAILNKNDYTSVKVYDLNQDFWVKNNMKGGYNHFYDRYQTLLQNVTSWNNPENYYSKIHTLSGVKELIDEYADILLTDNPKIVGFCLFNTNIWFTLEVCKVLKVKNPDVKIIVGGPEATVTYHDKNHKLREVLQDDIIDVVVFGEGDITVVEVCDTIMKDEYDYENILGIFYKGKDGEVKNTIWRPFISDLDTVPIPDYSDIDFSMYEQPEIPIVMSRGCNYGCIYCGVKLYWGKAKDFRKRSAQNIMDEIIKLEKDGCFPPGKFNFVSFKAAYINTGMSFNDDTILTDLCDLLIERYGENKVPFQWAGYARVDTNLTPELCKKMYLAGCHHLTFGFESGSARINKEMRKGYNFKDYNNEYAVNVFKNCMENGVMPVLFLIVGYPTETEEDFQKTMKFLKDSRKYIDAVYCMSTFILSKEMMSDDPKWGKERFHLRSARGGGGDMVEDLHAIEWESEVNTYEDRVRRLEEFKKYSEEVGLTSITPRLPDDAIAQSTPDGTPLQVLEEDTTTNSKLGDKTKHKLAICVPHYKREEHLKKFIPHMDEFFKDKDIDFKIFVANQVYPDSVSGFNRGTSKNVAFDVAQKEGYDYFCFHDIDMLPEDDSCDYSYPDKVEHLAVHVEQFDYGLKYQEYFGGAILFTKEHYEQINGYSNGYFNWGMEDDDLFYRTKKKGLAEETFMNHESDEPRSFLRFNGLSDYMKISPNDSIREVTMGNFTIAALVRAEDRFDIPKYLIGDVENRKFIHQYIFGRPSFQMGLGWDNSDAYSFGLFNQKNKHSYMWIKRHPDVWTHLMITVNVDEGEMRFYLNGKESDSRFGHGSQSPLEFESPLKRYGGNPFYLGVGDPNKEESNFFAGDIAQLCIFVDALSKDEVKNYYGTDYPVPTLGSSLYYDFSKVEEDIVYDLSGNGNHGISNGCSVGLEPIGNIPYTTLPYRSRPGRYKSLSHPRNDIVGNRFVHQKDTSVNEKRFVEDVQGGIIDIDEHGLTDLNYSVVKREKLFGTEHEMIDFRCEQEIPSHVEF